MQDSVRLFLCAGCRRQVTICSRCDRGHRYCGPGCARPARRASLHAAGRRYQSSRRGRFAHAARQHRYRQRQQEVTHQGSPAPCVDASLPPAPRAAAEATHSSLVVSSELRCQFCHRPCSGWVRVSFLHRRRLAPATAARPPQLPTRPQGP